jgi:hypothetical protein
VRIWRLSIERGAVRWLGPLRTYTLTEKGKAIMESGLSVRQAHEIETGCSPHQLCGECLEITDRSNL